MLARTLRLAIALQTLVGAALGFWLGFRFAPTWTLLTMVFTALAVPVSVALLAVLYSCSVSRSDEPAALWWRSLAGECWAAIQVFLLRQPWALAAPQTQIGVGGQAKIAVLLVHGYGCNYRLWDAIAAALRAQGHALLAINLEPVFTSIDDYALGVETAVQALLQQTGQQRLALVGHSMGGLAMRAWMRRFGTAQVARAITLGTPHVGTQINPVIATPNALQMAWQSPWLQDLAAAETEATRSLFRVALTPQDNIVFPQRAQTLQGVRPVVFEGLGHLQLCTDAKVIAWVCSELALL